MQVFMRVTILFISIILSSSLIAQTDPWAEVISSVSNSVVSLQVSQVRDFEDADQGVGAATGFIVDAEQGIILTNRHVIGAGPIRATATFQNQERINVVPLYRDPVHDFGFLRYDPKALKYLHPKSLRLRPDKVSTGMNIRIIGSDGGEQLSILAGTIARTDRKAPNYGRYEYNDFNTFYFQAASSTSGGSSGSPVLDSQGNVVALNAAANTRTASSFFLPLDRIKRALELLQKKQSIARGALQTVFDHRSFRDLRTLGLDEKTEQLFRGAGSPHLGMLLVKQVLPSGNSDGILSEGDILISINDLIIPDFVSLEMTLDSLVGEQVNLVVLRQGQRTELEIVVADLHSWIPDRLIELGDSVIQDMSLQHVHGMNLPRNGVVLVKDGFMFEKAGIPEDALIVSINNQPISNVEDVLAQFDKERFKTRWLVRFIVPGREFSSEIAQLDLDRQWFRYRSCQRKDDTRFWDCQKLNLPPLSASSDNAITPFIPGFDNPLMQQIGPAMVRVDFNIPYVIDNVFSQHFSGTGLVVDAKNGIISIDRNTVPISMGNATVTFFGSYELSAEVVFLNPLHNLALIKYDPKQLKGIEIPELQLAKSNEALPETLFRLAKREDGTHNISSIGNANRVTVSLDPPRLPRFQQTPVDVYTVSNLPPSLGGPVVDEQGVVHAIWMSFAYEDGKEIKEAEWAMPVRILSETLKSYRAGGIYYSMDLQLRYRSLSSAIQLGLNSEWLQKYAAFEASRRRVLSIEQTIPGTTAADLLLPGDVLLSIDGKLVTDLLDAEAWSQNPQVNLQVLRGGQVKTIALQTSVLNAKGTQRFISWAGAFFQQPHREIALYEGISLSGVYIADTLAGSPAIWDRLYRNRLVTEVDGVAVKNLDEFLAKVREKKQDEFTRLTVVSLSGRRDIISVSPDFYFWPTFEITRSEAGWQRIDYAVDETQFAESTN